MTWSSAPTTLATGPKPKAGTASSSTDVSAGDPDSEVQLAWACYQQLRAVYAGTASLRKRAEKLLDTLHTCPIPEVARLGRTLRAWRAQVLAYFGTDGLSNGGTEAISMLIGKARRLASGYRNVNNYRLRAPDAPRRQRNPHPTRQEHEPVTTLDQCPGRDSAGGIVVEASPVAASS